jgi:HPt (histidine-containing phosphotransfer) domain-containing protein
MKGHPMDSPALAAFPSGGRLYFSTLARDPDLAEIVALFVRELPDRLGRLSAAADAADLTAVASLAHQLKGAGGSHGFEMLTTLAAELERAAIAGKPLASVRARLDDLRSACEQIRAGTPS